MQGISDRRPVGRRKRAGSWTAQYWLMLVPALAWLLIFNLKPMLGIVMAFQDFNPGLGILRSPWVGLENFEYMFTMRDTGAIFFNTVFIAVMKILGNLLVPLVFALMLNEVANSSLKKTVQTIVYLPHFISWVILAGILKDIFSLTGPINRAVELFGGQAQIFFAKEQLFPWLVIGSDVWKEFGFNAVVYLAALTGINPSLYEAAAIDGAGRWRRMWNITLPGITSTIVLLGVLSLSGVLNAGFDQIFNLYNPMVYPTGDIIDTWVYRTGLNDMQYSLATAVGLLKSVVGFVLVTGSYGLAYKFSGYRIF